MEIHGDDGHYDDATHGNANSNGDTNDGDDDDEGGGAEDEQPLDVLPAEDYLHLERLKKLQASSSSSSSSSGVPINTTTTSNISGGDAYVKKGTRAGVRKPQSTWLLFLGERREVVMKEQPGLLLQQVVRIIGEQFRNLSQEEKDRLELLAHQDKERYARELEVQAKIDAEIKANNAVVNENGISIIAKIPLSIPVARVKRTIKLDPDVKNISKESVELVTKAVELFIGYLTTRSSQGVMLRGSKQVNEYDLLHTIHTNKTLEFLRLDFPNKSKPKKVKVTEVTQQAPVQNRSAEAMAFKNFFNQKSSNDEIFLENNSTNPPHDT
jgi:histone H3/H4